MNFTVAHDGFANTYSRRPVEIVLRRKAGGEVVRLATKEDAPLDGLWRRGHGTRHRKHPHPFDDHEADTEPFQVAREGIRIPALRPSVVGERG